MDKQEQDLLIIDEKEKTLYEKLRERFRYGHAVEDIPLVHLAVDCGVNYRDAQGVLAEAIVDAWDAEDLEDDDPDHDPYGEDVYFFDEDEDDYEDVLVYGEDPDDDGIDDLEDEIDRIADLMAHGRL